jgi:arginine decarboxylase
LNIMDQNRTPLFDALKKYVDDGVIPFHVPGHKRGRGIKELTRYLGQNTMAIDVNGMEDLDNICNPIGVIKQSAQLLAQLYGADHAFFLVNGTSQGIHTMILNTCKPGDEIILPRNAHKSTIGAIILSGAMPVYVQPEINYELGIAMGMSIERVERAMTKHPNAVGIFVINPTYYGVVSDLRRITSMAHDRGMAVLADEAHGSHLKFSKELPSSAMDCGINMSAISLHKTGGSLTQSSALIIKGDAAYANRVKSSINLTQTTSASYILMASLDVARKQLALRGEELVERSLELARYARRRINAIPGLYAFGKEITGKPGSFDFDETKLGIHVRGVGLTGYKMETILRKKYNIQIELSDLYNIMAIISLGDTREDVDALIKALEAIAREQGVHKAATSTMVPYKPKLVVSPREAYYSIKRSVKLEEAEGEISGEMIMAYPPGIPAICPGEKITREVIEYIQALKREECQLQGPDDPYINHIKVLGQ